MQRLEKFYILEQGLSDWCFKFGKIVRIHICLPYIADHTLFLETIFWRTHLLRAFVIFPEQGGVVFILQTWTTLITTWTDRSEPVEEYYISGTHPNLLTWNLSWRRIFFCPPLRFRVRSPYYLFSLGPFALIIIIM